MNLLFNTLTPAKLKAEIITLVEEGRLQTWTIQEIKGNKYLKHTGQWGEKGVIYLTPNAQKNTLTVDVRRYTTTQESVKDFEGYYLGRFCELMFVNFKTRFTSIDME